MPVPENYSSDQSNEFNSMRTLNCVRAVSSDGKYMAGQVYVSTGEIDEDFGIEKVKLLPVVWENNEIKKVYDDLGINTFYVYGISEDGSTVVGVNTAENGGQNPAYIKDGKLYNCSAATTLKQIHSTEEYFAASTQKETCTATFLMTMTLINISA